MELKEIESAIEGVLFAAGEPVGVERLCLALDIDRITADSVCQRLADAYRYERRGIRLVRLDNSYQLCSAPEFAACISRVSCPSSGVVLGSSGSSSRLDSPKERRKVWVVRYWMGRPGTAKRPHSSIKSRSRSRLTV